MTNRERIEAYFDDQLSTTEKESLLRDIESDPSLKTEFDFQNEVIEGIQNYRKQELITRLNNVEVASVGTSTLTKILGTIGVAAVVTGGLYWYFGTESTIKATEDKVEIVEEITPKTEAKTNTIEEDPTEVALIDNKKEAEKSSSAPVKTISPAKSNAKTSEPNVKVPEMTEPDSEGIAAVDDNHDAPDLLKSEGVSVSSSADVEVKLDKKYNFHYQVVDGDLTLYGEFNKSKFEIIELKTNQGIKLFLYYNKGYFELKDDSSEIRPLIPVENQEVINELDKRRQ